MSSFNTNFTNAMFSTVSKMASFVASAVSSEPQGFVGLNPPTPMGGDDNATSKIAAVVVCVTMGAAFTTYVAWKFCCRRQSVQNADNVTNDAHYQAMQNPEYAVNNPQVAVVVAPVTTPGTRGAQAVGAEVEMCDR